MSKQTTDQYDPYTRTGEGVQSLTYAELQRFIELNQEPALYTLSDIIAEKNFRDKLKTGYLEYTSDWDVYFRHNPKFKLKTQSKDQ